VLAEAQVCSGHFHPLRPERVNPTQLSKREHDMCPAQHRYARHPESSQCSQQRRCVRFELTQCSRQRDPIEPKKSLARHLRARWKPGHPRCERCQYPQRQAGRRAGAPPPHRPSIRKISIGQLVLNVELKVVSQNIERAWRHGCGLTPD